MAGASGCGYCAGRVAGWEGKVGGWMSGGSQTRGIARPRHTWLGTWSAMDES